MRFRYRTRRGLAEIVPHRGRWVIVFAGEVIEPHASPQSAAEAIANGYCSFAGDVDTSTLGIPEDLSMWERSA